VEPRGSSSNLFDSDLMNLQILIDEIHTKNQPRITGSGLFISWSQGEFRQRRIEFSSLSFFQNEKGNTCVLPFCLPWSRRDSNPRPNKERLSFLHVYLILNFRAETGYEHPTSALSLFSFALVTRLNRH
jgi:hypothetical protein